LKLEFSKPAKAVQDKKFKSNKRQGVDSPGVERPHRPAEIISERLLVDGRCRPKCCRSDPLSADDRTQLSTSAARRSRKLGIRRRTDAAIEFGRLRHESLCRNSPARKSPRRTTTSGLREFCGRFAERAFRRPLTDEQKKRSMSTGSSSRRATRCWPPAHDAAGAQVATVLVSQLSTVPNDQQLTKQNPGDQYDVAARLSFGLWDSPPDAVAVASGPWRAN